MTSLLTTEATPTTEVPQGDTKAAPVTAPDAEQKPAPATPPVVDKPKEEAKPAEEAAKKDVAEVPENYEFKAPKGMPDGHQLDETVLGSFSEVARELKLSQENAQKLIDKVLPAIHQRTLDRDAELHLEWKKAAAADKVIGGAKLEENLATARLAIKAYGDAELQQLLNGPLGSHPAILRALVKAGKTAKADSFVAADTSEDPTSEAALARKLYPKSS